MYEWKTINYADLKEILDWVKLHSIYSVVRDESSFCLVNLKNGATCDEAHQVYDGMAEERAQ